MLVSDFVGSLVGVTLKMFITENLVEVVGEDEDRGVLWFANGTGAFRSNIGHWSVMD